MDPIATTWLQDDRWVNAANDCFNAMMASIGENLWSFALSLENTTPILYKKGVRVRCVYLNGALDLPQTDKRKRPAPQKGDRTAKAACRNTSNGTIQVWLHKRVHASVRLVLGFRNCLDFV